ncbi:MAG: cytochrome ubiquinol oxidase subunit I [Burkholderiaceae bacterium]|nr:MAG: cytochrome ubiquinol oxidase subunit I [Burkholderiaceae bacterium]
MEVDAFLLARLQFAANITFHILFPTISIALGWALLFFKWRFNRTGDAAWMQTYAFWIKVFALTFALGVVSGVTMSFQFGTNWPGFMTTVGNIAGPLLAYEVLTAFFLEATFLGILLFGRNRVSNRVHTLATFLVALGTTLSAYWILALNSWMHTPVGFEMRAGVAHATDWLAILCSPSLPYRLTHMLLASGLTVAFLIAGVSAYRWLRGDRTVAIAKALRTSIYTAALLIPLQIFAGDQHGLNTLEYQPAKIAAIEGVWYTERGAPLLLFAWPDEAEKLNRFELAIPRLASLILTHDPAGQVRGLDDFGSRHPPVKPLFFGFRIMVGIAMLMLLVSWTVSWKIRRGKTLRPWLLRTLVAMTFSGWLATVAGWYVTEIGRQPYLVYRVLLTEHASSQIAQPTVALSLTLYLLLYAVLIVSYISVLFYLARKAGATESTSTGAQA